MKKHIIIVTVVLIAFIAVVANSDFITHTLLGYSAKATGRDITTNDIDINWGWPVTRVTVTDLTLSNMDSGSDPTMLSVKKARVGVNLLSMLKGTLAFREITLDSPSVLLEKNKDGEANWSFGKNPVAGSTLEAVSPDDRSDFPVIEKLAVNDGKLIFRDPVKNIDVTLIAETVKGGASSKDDLHFKGEGTYQKRIFNIEVDGGNVFQLKDSDDPYPLKLNVTAGNTKASIDGTVLDPFALKGINVDLTLQGSDAAELFTLIGMALPPTPPYKVAGKLNYTKEKWNFENFKGNLGDSDLHGSVTWDTERERPLLSGEFISNNLDFDDLGGFIGATPSTKGNETSSEKQKQKAAAAERNPYLIPDTPLDISRLAAMDADVTFTGKKLISQALPLDDFFMKVDLNNSILKLSPIRFGTAKGDISAFMTVNAQTEPVKISGDFTFKRLSLKPIFEKLADKFNIKNVTEGYIGGAAKLEGTGKSLRQMLATAYGDIGVGMEGGQLSSLIVEVLGLDVAQGLGFFLKGDEPVPVRCMIGDFNVKNGMMQVRNFVIDTTDSNITGKGAINLKNEKMDMTLHTMPKDNSILSLNSPIRLTGTLKKPDVGVKAGNLIGRGAAAAVGAAIFAPVGFLAFIEPGLGKDSNCGKLVSQLEKNTDTKANLIPKNKMAAPKKEEAKLSADR